MEREFAPRLAAHDAAIYLHGGVFARIDAVSVDTVKDVAFRYIRDECPAIAAIGPVQFLPDYNWFRQSTYSQFY